MSVSVVLGHPAANRAGLGPVPPKSGKAALKGQCRLAVWGGRVSVIAGTALLCSDPRYCSHKSCEEGRPVFSACDGC